MTNGNIKALAIENINNCHCLERKLKRSSKMEASFPSKLHQYEHKTTTLIKPGNGSDKENIYRKIRIIRSRRHPKKTHLKKWQSFTHLGSNPTKPTIVKLCKIMEMAEGQINFNTKTNPITFKKNKSQTLKCSHIIQNIIVFVFRLYCCIYWFC